MSLVDPPLDVADAQPGDHLDAERTQAPGIGVAGVLAAVWGWFFVKGLAPGAKIDARPPRPYPNPDRHRIR